MKLTKLRSAFHARPQLGIWINTIKNSNNKNNNDDYNEDCNNNNNSDDYNKDCDNNNTDYSNDNNND